VKRRSPRRTRALAKLKADALVREAWSAHVREQASESGRAQRAKREEANRQELLAILAAMRRRGWKTR
jgi:hypothetical protein